MSVGIVRRAVIALCCVGVVLGWACSEEWEPVVFVATAPDAPARFAAGRLGFVNGHYALRHLVVAYLYLRGGKLSAGEQKVAVAPAVPEPDYGSDSNIASDAGVSLWKGVRGATAPSIPSTVRNFKRQYTVNGNTSEITGMYLNCPSDAFATAAATYTDRVNQWGAGSPVLANWVAGQDAVFSNCGDQLGSLPGKAPDDAPSLLKQDRAYQMAAAHFYRGEWDEARSGFEAINRDNASPWQPWGGYLAARADVRQSYMEASLPTGDMYVSTFEPAHMRDASRRLQAVLHETHVDRVRHAAQMELEFVRIRVDSAGAVDAIARTMEGTNDDPDFEQHLIDLRVIQRRGSPMGNSDLALWIAAMQKDPAAAYGRWKQQPNLPWLIAALSSTTTDSASAQELLEAAAHVNAASPGYTTVTYERARTLLRLRQAGDAREVLSKELPALEKDSQHPSAANAFLGLRMLTAEDLSGMLRDAPRTMVDMDIDQTPADAATGSCNAGPGSSCKPELLARQFADDSAIFFNERFPLSLWVDAAKSAALQPESLRSGLAMAGWTRSVLLNEDEAARALLPLLPKPIQAQAGDGTGFAAVFAMLHDPGLRPLLLPGPQPSVNFGTLYGHGSWWCSENAPGAEGQPYALDQIVWPLPDPLFLKLEQKTQAATEIAALNKLPPGSILLSQRALAYAKEHPEDARVPEALAMSVRAMHYGCDTYDDPVRKQIGKAVFDLLHRRYPESEWTKKTPYYY